MGLTNREAATIYAALIAWEDKLSEGEKWITSIYDFHDHSPLSIQELRDLRQRFRTPTEPLTFDDPAVQKLFVPTYVGSQNALNRARSVSSRDFTPTRTPVLVHEADGIRVLLGTDDRHDRSKPDIQIERRPRGWAIFLHPSLGDPVGCVFILDNGRTFLLPERHIADPIELVDDIPPELDSA